MGLLDRILGRKKKAAARPSSRPVPAQPSPQAFTYSADAVGEGVHDAATPEAGIGTRPEAHVVTPGEGAPGSPPSAGLLTIVRNFPWLVRDLIASPLYAHIHQQSGGDGERIRAELSSILGGDTLSSLLQDAQNVKAFFEENVPDKANLLHFVSATIANYIYPKIDPVDQSSYPIKKFRTDLESAIKIIEGRPEYEDLLARGTGFARVREVAVAAVQAMQTVGGPVDQQLTANLDELKAYMSGKEGDIADVVTGIQADKSGDAEGQEEARGVAENLPRIPGYLVALSNPATDNLDNLGMALSHVNLCGTQIKRLSKDLYKSLADATGLVDDSIRLRKLRGYLQGYDATQMPPLNDLDIAYVSISSVATASMSMGQAMEQSRMVDEQGRAIRQQHDTLTGLRRDYVRIRDKRYGPLSANYQRIMGDLHEILKAHKERVDLSPAALEPLKKLIGLYEDFEGRLAGRIPTLKGVEILFDEGAEFPGYFGQLLSGIANTLELLETEKAMIYTTANALLPIDPTMVAGDAADWCSFVYDYALEEIKDDREHLVTGDRIMLDQIKKGARAIDWVRVAPLLKKLERTNGETEQELIARAGRIIHGGHLLDQNTRRAYYDYAIAQARAEVYLRNLEFHLSDIFTGIKLYDGSNDEESLRRAGVRANPDDIADEYVRERVKAVTGTLSEQGLVEKLRKANEQVGSVKAARTEHVRAAIAEREGEIRADEREKTWAEAMAHKNPIIGAARYIWRWRTKRRYVSRIAANALDYVGLGRVIDSIALGWYSMMGRRLTSPLDEQAYRLVQQRDDRISVARERLDQVQMGRTLGGMGNTPGQLRAARAYFRRQKKLADRAYTRQLRLLYK